MELDIYVNQKIDEEIGNDGNALGNRISQKQGPRQPGCIIFYENSIEESLDEVDESHEAMIGEDNKSLFTNYDRKLNATRGRNASTLVPAAGLDLISEQSRQFDQSTKKNDNSIMFTPDNSS